MLRGKLLTAAPSGSGRIADHCNNATSDYDDCVASDMSLPVQEQRQ
jgi:hypothetical protein